jgi:hypothetical protein
MARHRSLGKRVGAWASPERGLKLGDGPGERRGSDPNHKESSCIGATSEGGEIVLYQILF